MSACVVNYNGGELLTSVLDGLREQEHALAEILVVDNGSTDGSRDLVRREYPGIRLCELGENRGPGTARNAGYREATHELVLFVDNDVVLDPQCARRLLRALHNDPSAVFAMPRVLSARRPEIIDFEGAQPHFTGLMCLEGRGLSRTEGASELRRTGSLITACFLVDRSRWGDGPLFDESFFIYLEDHDLGIRARLRGWDILSVPDATCRHGEGTAGLSLRRSGSYSSTRVFLVMRNRWLVLLKNFRVRTLLVLAPVLLLFELFQLGGALKKGWLRPWLGAVGSVLRSLPDLVERRRAVQENRVMADRDLLVGGEIPFTDLLHGDAVERAARRALNAVCLAFWPLARRLL